MFQPKGPAVSKNFVFFSEDKNEQEHIPVAIPPVVKSLTAGLPRSSITYLLLNESDRHQYNPKELSLSKNAGRAFIAAVWGPRGSAPNSCCALLVLTAESRVTLQFPPSFHMNWKEVAVFSETLFDFFEKKSFRLGSSHDKAFNRVSRSTIKTERGVEQSGGKKNNSKRFKVDPERGRFAVKSVAQYTHKCAMMSTLTIAWSAFMVTVDKRNTTSLIALSGRKVSTIWAYAYPSFVAGEPMQPLLLSTPVAWIDTEKYGWVSTIRATTINDSPQELAVSRIIVAPHSQPVFGLCMGNRWTYSNSPGNDLIVASGSTISVWDLKMEQAQPNAKWKAHEGNITGIGTNYFGDTIFSAALDGIIKVWEKKTGNILYSSDVTCADPHNKPGDTTPAVSNGSKYPVFGLAMSPSSVQLACVFIIPPASRPNRKSQADVSYSRVSSSLEYIPSPWVRHKEQFVDSVCRILVEGHPLSSFMDVVWLCFNDNAASLNGATKLAIPSVLSKIKAATVEKSDSDVLMRRPIYLDLCEELEKRFYESAQDVSLTKGDTEPPLPLLLQASFLLRTAITPADHLIAAQNVVLAKIRRTLGVYWAERCLTALVRASKKAKKELRDYVADSSSEKTSALLMADFLSVQNLLTERGEALVTHVFNQLDSTEGVNKWIAYIRAKATIDDDNPSVVVDNAAAVYSPPSRELCFICEKRVPFGELELVCESGHTLERCFLSFRCIRTMEVWKCMGCGASASEMDFSSGAPPFYLLSAETDESDEVTNIPAVAKIICRLCGNYCSFSKY
ncbi:hypothetical protein PsorP6_004463 [Peronosclerospora sorghi]|uniref:Uncharacterized protein n=1 Tax=Peronosclerospora sorghi TaxID=230839 RepID=A0ACC0VKR5_9STRA|nr:hypothetical protein PsorP6_004463 [Peronosclerospora sorghi]